MSSDLRGIFRKVHSHELGFIIYTAVLSAGFDCIINCRKVLCNEFHFNRSQEIYSKHGRKLPQDASVCSCGIDFTEAKAYLLFKELLRVIQMRLQADKQKFILETSEIAYTSLQSQRD